MLGGLRNKAARGELRIPLPAGLIWGEAPGQILLHPDEAVRGAISAVFDRFAASGSARQVWLWLRENDLKLPSLRDGQLAWVTAAYPAVHKILTHPGYAGAYVYGRTRAERYIDASGTPAGTRRAVPRPEDWQVLLTGHHPGYIDWDTYLANTARLAANMAPVRGADGTGATREGCALLQGLAICGICGRRLGVFYRGPAKSIPGYQCNGGVLVGGGQGRFCTRVSGLRTDPAVAQHVLEVLTPLALQAAIDAADQIEAGHDAARDQWRRQAEQAATPSPGPSAATAPSTPRTGWSPVAWKPNGKPRCKPPRAPKPSWTAAKPPGPSGSAPASAPSSSPSPPTCPHCGRRRRPPTATARNSCMPSSTTSSSPPMRPAAPPASCCTGRAG